MTAQQTAMQTIRTGNAADAQLAALKAGGYLPAAVNGKANYKIDFHPTIP